MPASERGWRPVYVPEARARERARAVDDLRAKGEGVGRLAGLPMTVKDTFDVEGMAASSGLETYRRRRGTSPPP